MKKTIYRWSPYLVLGAGVLWALDGMLRRNLFALPPVTIVFFEHLIGSILLLPFLWKALMQEPLQRKDIGILCIIALLSGLLGTLSFTAALVQVQFISFSVVFLLQKLQPLFATLFAVIFLKERITPTYAVWGLVTVISAFFVSFPMGHINWDTGQGTVMAALLAVGAAFAWGTSTVFSKSVLTRYSYPVVTGYRFFLTTLFAGIVMLAMGAYAAIPAVTLAQYGQFLLIALSTGMVALVIYYKGLQHTEAKIATLLELSFPLLAVAIDAFVYQQVLHPSQYAAAVVLLYAFYSLSKLNYAK